MVVASARLTQPPVGRVTPASSWESLGCAAGSGGDAVAFGDSPLAGRLGVVVGVAGGADVATVGPT
jgi:hypothetical protein